ncbi:MAG: GWxTD domain-containing protein [Candidatus Krumholzibacteria bacterium]|nr:GWxTD domain-containing protein [Candidatus Krumholzibacteria bacterium]
MVRIRIVTVLTALVVVAGFAARDAHPTRLKKLSREDVRERSASLSPSLVQEIAALQYLLAPDDLAALLSTPENHRCRTWIDAWWAPRDPDYTSPQNEARVEHEHRVDVAREHFARGAWPGWDDRGEVFIRYGGPASYGRVPADVVAGIYIAAQEYWYYPQFDMFARFTDPTGSGRYFLYLEGVQTPVGARARSDRRNLASEWNPDRPMDYMTVDAEALVFAYLPPPFVEKGYDDFMKRVYRYYDVVEKTPVVYPFDFAAMRVPMNFAVHSFRGGDGVDRVDVNTEFESSVTPPSGDSYSRRFVTTTVFWDAAGHEIVRHARTDSVGTWSLVEDSVCTVVNQTSLTLPPGAYRVAVTVRESASGRFTSLRRTVGCPDMEETPAMSDLALARAIGAAREASPFNRGPLEVVPRPSACYRLGAPVPVYFEVYHLGTDADGAHSYTVEYAITPMSARPRSIWKRFISHEEPLQVRSLFEAVAPGPDDVVHVSASTQNLWPGEFKLEVTVRDGASSRRVSRATTFRLLEGD